MEAFGVIMTLLISVLLGVGLSALGLRLLLGLMPAKEHNPTSSS